MKIYNVYQSGKRLYIDEKENPDNKIVVNKYDNMQQTLRLISDGTLPPRLYWALRNPKLSNKYFILKLLNNEDLIVGTDISAYPGLWDMLLIGTDEDYIIEGTDIDQSRLTYVSDHFGRLFVRDNFLEELDFEEQCSPTFKVFYDEIMFQLDNKADKKDIPDKLSDLENDTNFISGVALKDDGEGNVKIVGTTFEGSETEEGGGGNYNLPVANETTLGGVKPLNKTEDMTLDVGVDKNGRLFAKGKDITVDSELDKESQNPVQNKVITAEVKALREENEALEQKNAELEEKNAELESSIEKLQIKTTTDKAPFHHITDSANMKVLDFGMEGITEQPTTSGKNVYSGGDVSGTEKIVVNIEPIPAGKYTFSANVVSSDTDKEQCSVRLYGENNAYGGAYYITRGTRQKFSFTINNPITRINFYASTDLDVSVDDTFSFTDIQIEEYTDGTATDYEPFTNGASPNPTHPQEIKLAGVLNEETGRYEHKCCVGNKNVARLVKPFDLSGTYGSWRIPYGNAEYVTMTLVEKDSSVDISGIYFGMTDTGIKETMLYNSWLIANGTIKNTVWTNPITKSKYITIYPKGDEVLQKLLARFDIQVELGSTATNYTPHASQPFTLTSDRPLTKWDPLVKRDGVWGWEVYSEEVFLKDYEMHAYDKQFYIKTLFKCESSKGVCKYLPCKYMNSKMPSFCVRYDTDIWFFGTDFTTIDEITQWINDNNVSVIVVKLEPVFIPLPEEEQTLLNNLETYYGVTNVYNEQGCPITLSYISDPELHWNQKLEQINNALLSLGANI